MSKTIQLRPATNIQQVDWIEKSANDDKYETAVANTTSKIRLTPSRRTQPIDNERDGICERNDRVLRQHIDFVVRQFAEWFVGRICEPTFVRSDGRLAVWYATSDAISNSMFSEMRIQVRDNGESVLSIWRFDRRIARSVILQGTQGEFAFSKLTKTVAYSTPFTLQSRLSPVLFEQDLEVLMTQVVA